jgi:hypothetical protein
METLKNDVTHLGGGVPLKLGPFIEEVSPLFTITGFCNTSIHHLLSFNILNISIGFPF